MYKEHYVFENLPLPYGYSALEPYIDTETMKFHHDKHLQTYVDNLNSALEKYPSLQNRMLEWLIYNPSQVPADIRLSVARNAGGVFNHFLYFDGLIPGGRAPSGKSLKLIKDRFGSFENCKLQLKNAGLSVFGSGYSWLVLTRGGRLDIVTTANQETPLPENLYPLLNLDVWEHAYYLKHQNLRADYIDDFFNVVDWEKVNERLERV